MSASVRSSQASTTQFNQAAGVSQRQSWLEMAQVAPVDLDLREGRAARPTDTPVSPSISIVTVVQERDKFEQQLRDEWQSLEARRNAEAERQCSNLRALQKETLDRQRALQQQLAEARTEVEALRLQQLTEQQEQRAVSRRRAFEAEIAQMKWQRGQIWQHRAAVRIQATARERNSSRARAMEVERETAARAAATRAAGALRSANEAKFALRQTTSDMTLAADAALAAQAVTQTPSMNTCRPGEEVASAEDGLLMEVICKLLLDDLKTDPVAVPDGVSDAVKRGAVGMPGNHQAAHPHVSHHVDAAHMAPPLPAACVSTVSPTVRTTTSQAHSAHHQQARSAQTIMPGPSGAGSSCAVLPVVAPHKPEPDAVSNTEPSPPVPIATSVTTSAEQEAVGARGRNLASCPNSVTDLNCGHSSKLHAAADDARPDASQMAVLELRHAIDRLEAAGERQRLQHDLEAARSLGKEIAGVLAEKLAVAVPRPRERRCRDPADSAPPRRRAPRARHEGARGRFTVEPVADGFLNDAQASEEESVASAPSLPPSGPSSSGPARSTVTSTLAATSNDAAAQTQISDGELDESDGELRISDGELRISDGELALFASVATLSDGELQPSSPGSLGMVGRRRG